MREDLFKLLTGESKGQIDPEAGLGACGSEEAYVNVLSDFTLGADRKISELKGFLASGDLENYIIKVHALKSTARFLGANGFSEMARELEEQGKAMDKKELADKSDALFSCYAFLSEAVKKSLPGEDEYRPMISRKTLSNALSAIRDRVEDFDFDQVDYLMERLAGYQMPEDFLEEYRFLQSCVTDVARDAIIEFLDSMGVSRSHG